VLFAAAFPLTPALSLGERENISAVLVIGFKVLMMPSVVNSCKNLELE
jgi:hypothetical protein